MTEPTATRKRNARGEGDRLRDDLIRSTLDVLARSGDPDDVSLRAVAKAVGVSPTAAYRHFEDRDALIEAACQACFDDFSERMLEATIAVPDPFDRLRAAGAAYIAYASEQDGHYRVLFSNPAPHDHEFDTTPDAAGSAFQQLVALVTDCLAAGAKPPTSDDPVYLAFQVWTWMHGIADLHLSHPVLPWPPVEQLVADVARALGLDAPA